MPTPTNAAAKETETCAPAKASSSIFSPRFILFVNTFAVLYGVGLVVYPEAHTWVCFSLSVATGNWDPCWGKNTYVASMFKHVHEKRLGLNPTPVAPSPVRELAKENYSWEALRIASDNFMEPVIVRGLFSGSAAVETWPEPGTLDALKDFKVSVVQNSTRGKDHWINCGGHPGVDTVMQNFGAALDEVRAFDPSSQTESKTLVVPPASRTDRVADPYLDAALGKLVERDLDLPRLGGSWHKGITNSALLQLWVGAGDDAVTQGTGLHCDICNNFIIQLAGSKHWNFIHPKNSALMRPTMRRGKTAISGADMSANKEVLPFIERFEATIRPGDFMYNPDWYWHSVLNAPGVTMAVVARECNVTNSFKANPVFSGLITANHVASGIFGGDAYALKRLKALVFGKSTMVPTEDDLTGAAGKKSN